MIEQTPNQDLDRSKYPFCSFRIPNDGGRVIWEVTNRCNYKCQYCIFSSGPAKILNELTTEEARKTIDGLRESDFKHIKVTGGEPFVRKDILDILSYATQSGMKLDISTNASLINSENSSALKRFHIGMVHISLDGPSAPVQEKIRGENTFERTVSGIRKVVDTGLYVRIGSVIYKGNEDLLEDTVRFCEDLGVAEIIFSKMEPMGRMKNDRSLVMSISPLEAQKRIREISERHPQIKVSYSFQETSAGISCDVCPGGRYFLYINNKGQVAPCTWIAEYLPRFTTIKTLKDLSLPELLKSPEILDYRNLIQTPDKENEVPGCPAQNWQKLK